jgi:murein L,D-transpeptidase YcbB/YkuD
MATVSALRKALLSISALFILAKGHAFNDSTYIRGGAHAQYALLQKEMNRFFELEQKGGWKKINMPKKFYMKGQTDAAIKQLKQRLQVSGDLSDSDTSAVFTAELVTAVQRVQKRFGFRENGVVDAQLVKALNVPIEQRLEQLQANIDRYSTYSEIPDGIWIVANIPEFKMHVYEGKQHVFDMNIVVGKESTKTITFNDEIKYIVFSPCWNVPPDIVRNEILPAMRNGGGYLGRNGYVQTGTENGLPVIKQLPGPNNSLGKVKFVFPNAHNIYFHDTPAKSLFEFPRRAFSHGCIRLAEPARLAEFLLRNTEWTPEKVQKAMDSGREQFVTLKKPVAISITYFTAWVDDDGLLNFREDIYDHDKAVVKRTDKLAAL